MEHDTAGNPMKLQKWSRKSLRTASDELRSQNITICPNTTRRLLKYLDYSLRANKKEIAETQHPDRDLQFQIIKQTRLEVEQADSPQISVDTKKKELIGNFKNNGKIWRTKDDLVNTHDFRSAAVDVASPYGIHDCIMNKGFVVVGASHDTPQFAVESIELWLTHIGFQRYPQLDKLLILCDAGGSNSCRARAWKYYLYHSICQKYGIEIVVCHYPTGASKWNPVEHRLFSFISINWAGIPLRTWKIMLNCISGTTTRTGLQVDAVLNKKLYKKGVKISDEQMQEINIIPNDVLPQWNYRLLPKNT